MWLFGANFHSTQFCVHQGFTPMRLALFTLVASLAAAPVLAESITAPILAFDRKANIIVLTDKTVWTLDAAAMVPDDLKSGDVVVMDYAAIGDDGLGKVTAIKLAE